MIVHLSPPLCLRLESLDGHLRRGGIDQTREDDRNCKLARHLGSGEVVRCQSDEVMQ